MRRPHRSDLADAARRRNPRDVSCGGGKSWRADSNRGPADYESAALPTELRQHRVGLLSIQLRGGIVNRAAAGLIAQGGTGVKGTLGGRRMHGGRRTRPHIPIVLRYTRIADAGDPHQTRGLSRPSTLSRVGACRRAGRLAGAAAPAPAPGAASGAPTPGASTCCNARWGADDLAGLTEIPKLIPCRASPSAAADRVPRKSQKRILESSLPML
jgi:hypothetical protein